jgi:hypothetical protein
MMFTECAGRFGGDGGIVAVQRALAPRKGRDIFMASITLQSTFDTPDAFISHTPHHASDPAAAGCRTVPQSRVDVSRLGCVVQDPVAGREQANHTGVLRFGNEAIGQLGGLSGARVRRADQQGDSVDGRRAEARRAGVTLRGGHGLAPLYAVGIAVARAMPAASMRLRH